MAEQLISNICWHPSWAQPAAEAECFMYVNTHIKKNPTPLVHNSFPVLHTLKCIFLVNYYKTIAIFFAEMGWTSF